MFQITRTVSYVLFGSYEIKATSIQGINTVTHRREKKYQPQTMANFAKEVRVAQLRRIEPNATDPNEMTLLNEKKSTKTCFNAK